MTSIGFATVKNTKVQESARRSFDRRDGLRLSNSGPHNAAQLMNEGDLEKMAREQRLAIEHTRVGR